MPDATFGDRMSLHVEVGPYEIELCTRKWKEWLDPRTDSTRLYIPFDLSPIHFAIEQQFECVNVSIAGYRQIQVYFYKNHEDRRLSRQYHECYASEPLDQNTQDWLRTYDTRGRTASKVMPNLNFSTVLVKHPYWSRKTPENE